MSNCICPICNASKKNLTKHVNMVHKLTKEDFLLEYPNTKMVSEETSEKISDSLRNNWKDTDYAEKCSVYWRSKEHGKEVSDRLKKTWKEDPDKYGISFKEFAKSERGREIRSNNMKKISSQLWEDESYVKRRRVAGRVQMEKNLQDPRFGYSDRTKCYYKGIYFRSSWEVNFAKYLDLNNIKYEYETYRFQYSNQGIEHIYIPDFFLVDYNLFIEIKPACNINNLTDIKLESVRNNGYKIEYITDCSEKGLNSQLVPLLSN